MNVPEGWKLVPIEPPHEVIKAMAESRARTDEGVYSALCDLIDFSGEDKTRAVLKAAYAAALGAAPAAVVQAEVSELPPLPEPTVEGSVMHPELKICYRAPVHFTADQMREYATAARGAK